MPKDKKKNNNDNNSSKIITSLAVFTKEVDACGTSKKKFSPFVKIKVCYHLNKIPLADIFLNKLNIISYTDIPLL